MNRALILIFGPGRLRRNLVVTLTLAAIACGITLYWRPWAHPVRAVPNDPITLARIVGSQEFEHYSMDDKRAFVQALRPRRRALAVARIAGRISPDEYNRVLLYAYLEGKILQMDNYFGRKPADRPRYLDELIRAHARTHATTAPEPQPNYTAFFLEQVAKWPEARRKQWDEFRLAYHNRANPYP